MTQQVWGFIKKLLSSVVTTKTMEALHRLTWITWVLLTFLEPLQGRSSGRYLAWATGLPMCLSVISPVCPAVQTTSLTSRKVPVNSWGILLGTLMRFFSVLRMADLGAFPYWLLPPVHNEWWHKTVKGVSTTSLSSYFHNLCVSMCANRPLQCSGRSQECWCVDAKGQEIAGTRTNGSAPYCEIHNETLMAALITW